MTNQKSDPRRRRQGESVLDHQKRIEIEKENKRASTSGLPKTRLVPQGAAPDWLRFN